MVLSQNEIDGELKSAELSDNVPPFVPTDSMSMFYHGAHEILTIDVVTGADLITVQQNFGNVAGGQDAALPEPATAILILFGLSSCIQRRHELGR